MMNYGNFRDAAATLQQEYELVIVHEPDYGDIKWIIINNEDVQSWIWNEFNFINYEMILNHMEKYMMTCRMGEYRIKVIL